jgi:hypothetical protein
MTYHLGAVAVIKANGKVLREIDGTVLLPFGAEYSILIKNLKSRRIMASVSIDGQDVSDGQRFIAGPNSSVEIERFIRNGNLQAGNRFRFIERSAAVEEHRGIQPDDGIVRVECWTEQAEPERKTVIEEIHRTYPSYPYPWPVYPRPHYPWPSEPWVTYTSGSIVNQNVGDIAYTMNSATTKSETLRSFSGNVQAMNCCVNSAPSGMAGITVPGGESTQTFSNGAWFPVEAQSDVLVLNLRGCVAGKAVKQPITVKTKKQCVTCGKTGKSSEQFCGRCGTALSPI